MRAGTAIPLPSPRSSIATTAYLSASRYPVGSPRQGRPCLTAGCRTSYRAGAACLVALPLTCSDPQVLPPPDYRAIVLRKDKVPCREARPPVDLPPLTNP